MRATKVFVYWGYFIIGVSDMYLTFSINQDMYHMDFDVPDIEAWSILIFSPWIVKAALGLISDYVGIAGYHRKPYIVTSYAVSAVLNALLATRERIPSYYIPTMFFLQMALCWADIIVDALASKDCRLEQGGDKETYIITGFIVRVVGNMVGLIISGRLYDAKGSSERVFTSFSVICGMQFMLCMVHPWYDTATKPATIAPLEPNDGEEDGASDHREEGPRKLALASICSTCSFSKYPILANKWYVQLLVLNIVIGFIPTPGAGYFFYLTSVMGYTATTFSNMQVVACAARIAMLVLYKLVLRYKGIRTTYLVIQIIDACIAFFPALLVSGAYRDIGIPPIVFVLSGKVLDSALTDVRLQPVHIMNNVAATVGTEAAILQVTHTALNATGLLVGLIESALLRAFGINHGDFDGLFNLILTCGTLEMIVPVVCIFVLLPARHTTIADIRRKMEPIPVSVSPEEAGSGVIEI